MPSNGLCVDGTCTSTVNGHLRTYVCIFCNYKHCMSVPVYIYTVPYVQCIRLWSVIFHIIRQQMIFG